MANKPTVLEPSLDKNLKGHKNSITSVYYSPNEQQIATGSLDNSVLLWDVKGTLRSYRFQGHDEAVMDVTFSPTGKYMASASRDKTVRLWVSNVIGSTGVFKAHSQTVRSVQFSPDATKILTASDDKIVKLWSTNKYKFLSSFVGHTNWVRCARFTSDGSVIASCSDDKTVKLWDPESGKCIQTYKDQKGYGHYLAWHPSGCYVAVATSQGNVKLYDIRTHNLVQYYSIHSDIVTQVAFHPSGSYIITSSKDGKMKILDLQEGHPLFTLGGHTGSVNAVSFSPSGDQFTSAGDDKLIFIWKTNFTSMNDDSKENVGLNQPSVSRAESQTSAKMSASSKHKLKGGNIWNKCYHSTKYPVSTFVHLDDAADETPQPVSADLLHSQQTVGSILDYVSRRNTVNRASTPDTSFLELPSMNVSHTSHIPRVPPTPQTYTIPTVATTSQNILYGMITLKEHDVCYTSGTIEWVGKKRDFPINSGFKIINSFKKDIDEGSCAKKPKMNKFHGNSFHGDKEHLKECDCADVLPTVNAIVDHLNALHEAVDIVDLRLNNVEDVINEK